MNKQEALQLVEELRTTLIDIVNQKTDSLIQRIESGEPFETPSEFEFPLRTNPATFKGTKPTALAFGEERVAVKTWREVYIEILKRCCAEKHDALMHLRNLVSGRKRAVLSNKPDGMNKPIMLAEGLYVEAYFDTEFLLKTLTQILGAVRYDYSKISVKITERKYKFK